MQKIGKAQVFRRVFFIRTSVLFDTICFCQENGRVCSLIVHIHLGPSDTNVRIYALLYVEECGLWSKKKCSL